MTFPSGYNADDPVQLVTSDTITTPISVLNTPVGYENMFKTLWHVG